MYLSIIFGTKKLIKRKLKKQKKKIVFLNNVSVFFLKGLQRKEVLLKMKTVKKIYIYTNVSILTT